MSAWLHLGPFAQQDGASPGCGLMRMDHLTDGDITELDIEPEAGDEIETDYSPGAAASLRAGRHTGRGAREIGSASCREMVGPKV